MSFYSRKNPVGLMRQLHIYSMTKPVFVLLSVLMHVFPLGFRHHVSCKLNQIFSLHMRKCSDNSHVQPYMTYTSHAPLLQPTLVYTVCKISLYIIPPP